mmetsp:Transcript_61994/g.124309  ORF Transcript_61994/g.124309 Transcript_61994/m.124309 type:complete len:96 (+) Transcript_61994:344-631(+)
MTLNLVLVSMVALKKEEEKAKKKKKERLHYCRSEHHHSVQSKRKGCLLQRLLKLREAPRRLVGLQGALRWHDGGTTGVIWNCLREGNAAVAVLFF